jgi:hypothetical protein
MEKTEMKKPSTIHIELGKDVDDTDAMIAKLDLIIRTIRALQAEADYLHKRITDGLVAEGSLTPKDVAWMLELCSRGENRAAAEYFRGRLASHD